MAGILHWKITREFDEGMATELFFDEAAVARLQSIFLRVWATSAQEEGTPISHKLEL